MQNINDSHSEPAPDSARELLYLKFEEAKARNPMMSLRAFAKKLGVSSGSLSEILKGKRPLSNSVRRKIAAKLMLSPQETLRFFKDDLPSEMSGVADDRMMLSHDQFHLISNWWYFGILSLMDTRGFKASTSWIARRLGLAEKVVSEAWERLFRLGYLEKSGSGVVRKQGYMKTTDNLMDLSVRRSHLEDLKLIETSLQEIPLEYRDNTSTTFVIEKKDLAKAKEMIRIFQSQFLKQVSKDAGDEVYKLSIALYPLTQLKKENS